MSLLPLDRLRTLLLAACVAIASLNAMSSQAFGSQCDDIYAECTPSVVGRDKYVYSYDDATGVLRRARPRVGEKVTKPGDRRVWEYAYTPACLFTGQPDENGVFPGDTNCTSAIDHPDCPPGEFAMWGYRRLVVDAKGDPVSRRWQRLPGVQCFAADEEWTGADLRAIAEDRLGEYLEAHARKADIRVQPQGGSLVNVPVIAHTEPLPDIGFPITQPFPGRLDATATYAWSFGEGDVQHGPGNPYTEAVSPFDANGYYVAHAYSSPGSKTITLDTSWSATFTVVGIEIPVEAITFTSAAAVDVRTASSQLIAGDTR